MNKYRKNEATGHQIIAENSARNSHIIFTRATQPRGIHHPHKVQVPAAALSFETRNTDMVIQWNPFADFNTWYVSFLKDIIICDANTAGQ